MSSMDPAVKPREFGKGSVSWFDRRRGNAKNCAGLKSPVNTAMARKIGSLTSRAVKFHVLELV